MKENNNLMVSVDMITYGHEKYIRQAIEGVLNQETNFEYDLVIADDCSPDNTSEIVEDIIRNHPRGYRIKYFRHIQNLGMQANGMFAVQQCKGKYIALCEGDDYWTDPLKLQKQVDFLENNHEFNLCVHRNNILVGNKVIKKDLRRRWDKSRTVFSTNDYIYNLFFHTSSVVFRKIELPNYLLNSSILQGDIASFLIIINKGKIFFINEAMSVYRMHEGGITNSQTHKNKKNAYQSLLFIYENFNVYSDYMFNTFIKLKIKEIKALLLFHDYNKNWFFKTFIVLYYYSIKLLMKSLIYLKVEKT